MAVEAVKKLAKLHMIQLAILEVITSNSTLKEAHREKEHFLKIKVAQWTLQPKHRTNLTVKIWKKYSSRKSLQYLSIHQIQFQHSKSNNHS